jgi:hypothetical protein
MTGYRNARKLVKKFLAGYDLAGTVSFKRHTTKWAPQRASATAGASSRDAPTMVWHRLVEEAADMDPPGAPFRFAEPSNRSSSSSSDDAAAVREPLWRLPLSSAPSCCCFVT